MFVTTERKIVNRFMVASTGRIIRYSECFEPALFEAKCIFHVGVSVWNG
jgi:hypothetical protein